MAPLPESMIGYSQRLDLLSTIYNVRRDKDKNNKCVKKAKKSNTFASQTSNAKCRENCRVVTKTVETFTQQNGQQLKRSQDPIHHKSKPLKDVQPSDSSNTANVTTKTKTVIKTPLRTKTVLNKNPYVEPSDLLQKTQPIEAQKSTTTVLKRKTGVVPSDTFQTNKPNKAHKGTANVVSKNQFVVPSDSHEQTKPIKPQRSNTTFANKEALVVPSDSFQMAHPIKIQKSTTTIPRKRLCAVPSDSLQRTRLIRAQASTSIIANKKSCLEPLESLQRNHSSKDQKYVTNGLSKKAFVVPLDSLKRNQAVRAQESKATVLNEKPSELLKQQNSQKKVRGVNPYAVKNMSDSQPRKKARNNNRLKSKWKTFERILQSDVYTLQELYKTDVNSVFDFGTDILNKLEEAPGGTAVQKMAWKGRVYYYFMKAYCAAGDQNSALEFSSLLLRFASTTKDGELLYNTYNITAKAYVMLEDYHTAIVLWEKMIKLTENLADQAYILHEIGRCYYALAEWSEARLYGDQSLSAAKECNNRQWCMSANLLIGQADIRLEDPKKALQDFEEAELYALTLNDEGLLSYIEAQKKLLQNVTETKCQ